MNLLIKAAINLVVGYIMFAACGAAVGFLFYFFILVVHGYWINDIDWGSALFAMGGFALIPTMYFGYYLYLFFIKKQIPVDKE